MTLPRMVAAIPPDPTLPIAARQGRAALIPTPPRGGGVRVDGPPAGAEHHRARLVALPAHTAGPARRCRWVPVEKTTRDGEPYVEWKQSSDDVGVGQSSATLAAWHAAQDARWVHRYLHAGRWWVDIRDGHGRLLLAVTADGLEDQVAADRVAREAVCMAVGRTWMDPARWWVMPAAAAVWEAAHQAQLDAA